jgi:hypothetical protein
MRRSLAKFSESEASNHTPSLADFTTTTPELKFSVHTLAITHPSTGRDRLRRRASGDPATRSIKNEFRIVRFEQINPFLVELLRRRDHFSHERSKATRSSVTAQSFAGA